MDFRPIDEEELPPIVPTPNCADPAEFDDPVEIEWACGLAIGQPYWQNVDTYESDECPGEGTVWAEREEWESGHFRCHCDRCGQFMEDDSHYILKGS